MSVTRAGIVALLVLNVAVLGIFGQSPASPTFDVASVRPNNLDTRGFTGAVPAGKGFSGFKATNARLKVLVMLAYNVADWQLTGGPAWTTSDGFDIDAKTESPVSYQQIQLMLQALLAERFKLQITRETKESPIYALMVDKEPPKFVLHEGDAVPPLIKPGSKPDERIFQNIPIARLTWMLSGETGRTVVDKTGLQGNYDFKLEWTTAQGKGGSDDPEATGRSIFAALRQQLGLRLEAQRGPSEHLIIEHVEKPSTN